MIIDLYGREIEVIRRNDSWNIFYRGSEGKKRIAKDITIPGNIKESELIEYLSDIYHEYSNERNSEVKIIS